MPPDGGHPRQPVRLSPKTGAPRCLRCALRSSYLWLRCALRPSFYILYKERKTAALDGRAAARAFLFYDFEGKESPLSRRVPGLFVKGKGIPAFGASAGLVCERGRRALFGRAAAGFISSVRARAFFFSVRARFERVSALSPRFRVFSGAALAPRARACFEKEGAPFSDAPPRVSGVRPRLF